MSIVYCEFKGTKYRVKKKNNELIITSQEKKKGFVNYIDILGKEHDDLFMKKVTEDEIDSIYSEDIFLKFKNVYFEIFADKITKKAVADNAYVICTDSDQLAYLHGLEKKEQFLYVKTISRKEIEEIKIVKNEISQSKKSVQTQEIVRGKNIDEWLAEQ